MKLGKNQSGYFSWESASEAARYSVCLKDITKPNDCDEIASSTTTEAVVKGLGAIDQLTATYFVIARNAGSEVTLSNERSMKPEELTPLIQYIKASNTGEDDQLGESLSLSADGNTLAAGASYESSNATGVNGAEDNNASKVSGAVYVYRFESGAWTQHSYIKASNTGVGDGFGWSLSLSADGNTLAVGAPNEDSNATGIHGEEGNNNALNSGAVYVYRLDSGTWTQQAYLKASNTEAGDQFGSTLSLSADGNKLVVGAYLEDSQSTGINNAQDDNTSTDSGAVYVFI